MAQCIAYIRVSTRGQGWGHGLVRQLECIQSHAKKTHHWIRSVYCDIGSGTKPLPQRALAIAEAQETGYPLFVEAVDRFTRLASDISLFETVDVVVCGDLPRQLEAHLARLVKEFVNGTP
jgi:hypothetical protein